MKRRLFHATSARAAADILKNGFRDGRQAVGVLSIPLRGVFLSNRPLDENEGAASSEILLEVLVDLPKKTFDRYELVEEGKPYREWCFPAKVLKGVRARQVPRFLQAQ